MLAFDDVESRKGHSGLYQFGAAYICHTGAVHLRLRLRALLRHGLCDDDIGRFGLMNARLSQPVFPGDVLATRISQTDAHPRFQTVASGERVVLDRGSFTAGSDPIL